MSRRSSMLDGFAYGVLNEILAGFRGRNGYAKPSRYEVILYPPSGARGTKSKSSGALSNIWAQLMRKQVGGGQARNVGLRCSQISFPGRTLDTTPDTNIYGPTRDIVQGYSYANITGIFQLSSDLREKEFFESWQRLAFDPQDWSLGYFDDYAGQLEIFQLDEEDRRKNGVRLIECFPQTIADLGLDANQAGNVSTLQITFSYRYWNSLTEEADLPRPVSERLTELAVNTVERKILSQIPKVLSRL